MFLFGRRGSLSHVVALCAAAWLTIGAAAVSAAADRDSPTTNIHYSFDLPKQPLSRSLAAWSRIVQQTVLFNPQLLNGLDAPALQGQFTAEQAIVHLLSDAPLAAEPAAQQGWLVTSLPSETTPSTAPGDPMLDEVLVIGQYSRSLAAAINTKRDANQRQDTIIAEDIAKFPTLNVAEAINRSPGVSVIRDRGEALFISIRGLPSQFNRLTLNGQSLASHENVRTSEQYGRRFHYDTLPAELIAQVDVKKAPAAEEEEGSIGGQVDLRTFRPLELGYNAFKLDLGASHSELANATDPRASALASWVNHEQTLGLLIAGTYSERELRQDRALNFRWYHLNEAEFAEPERSGAISPGSVRPTLELEARRLQSVSGAVQWQPNEQLHAELNHLSLTQAADYQEFSYSADYDPASLVPGATKWRGNALIGGVTETGSVQISRESAGFEHLLRATDFTLDISSGPWQHSVSLATSAAQSDNSDPIRRIRLRRENDVSFRFLYPEANGSRVPEVEYANLSLTEASHFPGRRLEFRVINTDNEQTSAGLDVSRTLDHFGISRIGGGFKHSRGKHGYRRRDAVITEGIAGEYFPSDYFTAVPVDDFLHNAHGDLPDSWLAPREQTFWQNPNITRDAETLLADPPTDQDLLNSYAIEEQVSAGYVQLDLQTQHWRGNAGVRYAFTEQTSTGFRLLEGAAPATQVTARQRYAHLLPAANFAYELNKDLLLRLGAAKTLNRPDLQDLAPRQTLNSGDARFATGGNPELKPVTAWQYDSALEWYFAPRSLFSAGVFYTQLDGFIQSNTTTAVIGGQQYELTTPTNGATAQVAGLEFDYQQVFETVLGHSWGVQTNATWTASEARYHADNAVITDDLADVAGRTLNAGLFYETPRWEGRINYSWRGPVLKAVGTHTMAAQNSAAFGTWDAQTALSLNRNFRLVLEGINLTGESEQEFVGDGEFGGYSYYGRTYIASVELSL